MPTISVPGGAGSQPFASPQQVPVPHDSAGTQGSVTTTSWPAGMLTGATALAPPLKVTVAVLPLVFEMETAK